MMIAMQIFLKSKKFLIMRNFLPILILHSSGGDFKLYYHQWSMCDRLKILTNKKNAKFFSHNQISHYNLDIY